MVDWGTEGEKNVSEREEKIPSRSSLEGFERIVVAGIALTAGSVFRLIGITRG